MKNKKALVLVPALALGMTVLGGASAFAASGFQSDLDAQNKSGGSGNAMVTLDGNRVTVHAKAGGLAAKFGDDAYPHVAHIHIKGDGTCPTPDFDKNGDGIVDTPEGLPAYGEIGTTLTTSGDTSPKSALDLKRAFVQGGSGNYDRTFTLNKATMAQVKAGNAVIVVHGLDPAKLSEKAQKADSSPLSKDLPLAATAPALCGAINASQMDMPNGAAGTGGGTAQGPELGLLAGGSMLLAAGAALVARRRVVLKRAASN